jgi:2-succinyl-6-hydroxy-2,4-cyclohexadiene-1-carboxylate synthase
VIELLPPDFSVTVPTLPGHCTTVMPGGVVDVSATREMLLATTNTPGNNTVIWGYSLGARATLDLLVNEPGCARAAIIESGQPGIEDPVMRADRRSRDEALSRRLEDSTIEQFVEYWERIPALGDQTLDVIEKQRAIRMSHDPKGLAAALRGIGQAAYEPLWDRLGEIEIPVLLINGENDPVYRAHAEKMAGLLPDARQSVIAGAGHAAHVSAPVATSRVVVEFLESL